MSVGSHVVLFLCDYNVMFPSNPHPRALLSARPCTFAHLGEHLVVPYPYHWAIIATYHHPAGGISIVFKPINRLTVLIARRADSESVDCAPSFSSFLPSGLCSLRLPDPQWMGVGRTSDVDCHMVLFAVSFRRIV